jgi:hypothetical protein
MRTHGTGDADAMSLAQLRQAYRGMQADYLQLLTEYSRIIGGDPPVLMN